jgi:soluble lytic murein transglycosylase-like protein
MPSRRHARLLLLLPAAAMGLRAQARSHGGWIVSAAVIPSYRENRAAPAAASAPPAAMTAPPARESLRALVSRAARRAHISPRLARAVTRQESDWNPRAVSSAGAMGLMQLMPGTARDLGVRDAFNPRQNARAGVRFLHAMLARYHGSRRLGLAAYNAGPGAVDAAGGRVPPIAETRHYVHAILQRLARLRSPRETAAARAQLSAPVRELRRHGVLLFTNTE